MNRLKTLRSRFALWTAGLLLVVLILFTSFVYARMSQSLATSVDDALRNAASQVIAEVDVTENDPEAVDELIADLANTPLFEQGFTFRLYNDQGQLFGQFGPYQALPPVRGLLTSLDLSGVFTTVADEASQHVVRVYTTPIVERGQVVGIVQVAQNLINLKQTLNQLLVTLLIGVPLIVTVAAAGGYLLAGRALAPIDQITSTARHISSKGDLSARINLSPADDEVGHLAGTFDSMLARLDAAFQRERRFTADASHELRTPLTTMQTIISSMLTQKRTSTEYEQALVDLSEETDRMRGLTEGLLQLARGDGSPNFETFEVVDLSTLLRDVIDMFQPSAEAKRLALSHDIAAELKLSGDHDALVRLFVNLVGNAIKYTEQGQVTLSAKQSSDDIRLITVSDTGPGIPPEHLPHVFDRFYRIDASRSTAGNGLGLAIALHVAQAHQGTIEVTTEPNGGTTFIVKLPGHHPPSSP